MREFFKALLKNAIAGLAPGAATTLVSMRARRYSQRLVKQWGLYDINQKLIRELGPRVVSGSFKGMTLTPMTHAEHIGPYLLGTYEMELDPWWDRILAGHFELIIDVGAKFGYYAIGLALKFPQVPVVAFDTDWWARKALREMAVANRVSRFSIRGACTPGWMLEHLADDAFIISDCEGYERDLFCSIAIPRLATATMIIETHEHVVPGTVDQIASRFADSHEIQEVSSRSQTPTPSLSVPSLTPDELCRASTEVRLAQKWLFLVPKRS